MTELHSIQSKNAQNRSRQIHNRIWGFQQPFSVIGRRGKTRRSEQHYEPT